MAQKFIGLDDAAQKLGVTKERLNELREAGRLRAYRDGVSWKFRFDDIGKFAEEGLPSLSADSGLQIESLPEQGFGENPIDLEEDEIELDLGDDQAAFQMSDLDLAGVDEPTVPADDPSEEKQVAENEDDALAIDIEPLDQGDDAESILLSQEELGMASDRPPSTIIGRSKLQAEPSDDDLLLASDSAGDSPMSDVRLVDSADDVLMGSDSGVSASKFEGLEELEIDLEAESSRILEAQDIAAAQRAAEESQSEGAAKSDDFSLVPSDSDVAPASPESPETPLKLDSEESSQRPSSEISLGEEEEDEFVLDSSSDGFTLSSADSGINLKPSDSGLALDEAPLDLVGGGSASALDLGDALSAGGSGPVSSISSEPLAPGEDFLLTPLGDEGEDEESDSSQVIALDQLEEESEGVFLSAEPDDALGEEGQQAFAPVAGSPAIMAPEAQFSMWNVLSLGLCFVLMSVGGIMMVDLLRNIWSWDEPYSLNSSLIEAFLGIVGVG